MEDEQMQYLDRDRFRDVVSKYINGMYNAKVFYEVEKRKNISNKVLLG